MFSYWLFCETLIIEYKIAVWNEGRDSGRWGRKNEVIVYESQSFIVFTAIDRTEIKENVFNYLITVQYCLSHKKNKKQH